MSALVVWLYYIILIYLSAVVLFFTLFLGYLAVMFVRVFNAPKNKRLTTAKRKGNVKK